MKKLSELDPGELGVVCRLDTPEDVSLKLMEMGVGPGESVRMIRKGPLKGPVEIELMSYRLALRRSEAEKIFLEAEARP
jgi:Fe2+ transport system protein FeoA